MGKVGKLAGVMFAALTMRACVLEPVRMTDESMSPLLQDGDVVFVFKLGYGLRVPGAGSILLEWKKPQKNDLVVAVSVGDPPVNILRRITAVPGESFAHPDGTSGTLKDDEYFLVAEQKEGTTDSRKTGPVSRKNIIGKATYLWASKRPSSPASSGVESPKSIWRILQPL